MNLSDENHSLLVPYERKGYNNLLKKFIKDPPMDCTCQI